MSGDGNGKRVKLVIKPPTQGASSSKRPAQVSEDEWESEWDSGSDMEETAQQTRGKNVVKIAAWLTKSAPTAARPGARQSLSCKELHTKPDHLSRPIWVTPDKHIFLETYSPLYRQAYDFVIAIAEPLCRPRNIHEYELTEYSLRAAISVGLDCHTILTVLNRLCKTAVPSETEEFIREQAAAFGKAKLVLQASSMLSVVRCPSVRFVHVATSNVVSNPHARMPHEQTVLQHNRLFIEPTSEATYSELLAMPEIARAVVHGGDDSLIAPAPFRPEVPTDGPCGQPRRKQPLFGDCYN